MITIILNKIFIYNEELTNKEKLYLKEYLEKHKEELV
tara:strand:- start:870 stop:980 length:111 start_codon:yes stop_codon:yes gene_type:complete